MEPFEVEAAHAYARGSTTINRLDVEKKQQIKSVQMQNMRTNSIVIKHHQCEERCHMMRAKN